MNLMRYGVLPFVWVALTGCEMTNPFGSGATAPVEYQQDSSVTIVARDVEAPEVFSKSEQAIWDGRPTLGGVWVSHKSIDEPERAIVRNPANGQFVISSLFPRDPEDQGPPFQLSSEAATALGILPLEPVLISVTALRPEGTADIEPGQIAAVGAEPSTASAPAPLGANGTATVATA